MTGYSWQWKVERLPGKELVENTFLDVWGLSGPLTGARCPFNLLCSWYKCGVNTPFNRPIRVVPGEIRRPTHSPAHKVLHFSMPVFEFSAE